MLKRLLWWMVVALASYKRNWNAPLHRIHKTLLSFLVVELTHLPLLLLKVHLLARSLHFPLLSYSRSKHYLGWWSWYLFLSMALLAELFLLTNENIGQLKHGLSTLFFLLFPLFPSTFLFYYSRISYFQIVLMKSYRKCFSNPKKNLKTTNRKVHQNPFYSIF